MNPWRLFIIVFLLTGAIQAEDAEEKEDIKEEGNADSEKSDVVIHLKGIKMDQITIFKDGIPLDKPDEVVGNSQDEGKEKRNLMEEAANKIMESREHAVSIMEHSLKQLSKLFKAFEVPQLLKERLQKFEELFGEVRASAKKRLEELREMAKPPEDNSIENSNPNVAAQPPPLPPPQPPPPPPPPAIPKPIQRLQNLLNPNIAKIYERLSQSNIGQRILERLKNLGISFPEPKSATEMLAERLGNMHELTKKLTEASTVGEKFQHFLQLSNLIENFGKNE